MDDGDVAMAIGGTRPSTPRTPRIRASVASDERSHGNGGGLRWAARPSARPSGLALEGCGLAVPLDARRV
eukprot:scaffold1421_cov113-Isochrysis_galbana.AAC.3